MPMVVPARAIAERRVAEHFLSHDAVRPDSAIEYEPGRLVRARAFERLKDHDVIRGGANGRWYLDTPAWADRHQGRRKRVVAVALGAIIVGVIAAAL